MAQACLEDRADTFNQTFALLLQVSQWPLSACCLSAPSSPVPRSLCHLAPCRASTTASHRTLAECRRRRLLRLSQPRRAPHGRRRSWQASALATPLLLPLPTARQQGRPRRARSQPRQGLQLPTPSSPSAGSPCTC